MEGCGGQQTWDRHLCVQRMLSFWKQHVLPWSKAISQGLASSRKSSVIHMVVCRRKETVSIFLPSLPSLPQIVSSKESSGRPTLSSGAWEELAKDKSTPTGTRAECWEGLGSLTTAGLCRHPSESEPSQKRRVRPSRPHPVLMDGRRGGHQCSVPVPVLCKGTGLETLSDLPEPPETHGKSGGSLRVLCSL